MNRCMHRIYEWTNHYDCGQNYEQKVARIGGQSCTMRGWMEGGTDGGRGDGGTDGGRGDGGTDGWINGRMNQAS